MKFELFATDPHCRARAGRVTTVHGGFDTPVFMPVGTRGAVKAMTVAQLEELGAEIILGNTYHLHARPGEALIAELGGLHAFSGWRKPILTDSGGFQVFSLGQLRTITEDGVAFQSSYDGSQLFLGPESSVEIQQQLGSDIIMAFDECPPYPAEQDYVRNSMELTLRWAKRSLDARSDPQRNAIFGIAQGGFYEPLRRECIACLTELPFDGFAIGGVSVGEQSTLSREVIAYSAPLLPTGKPRYLMGMGTPEDMLFAVEHGVDMFDCVLPTRNARNGGFFASFGKASIRNERFKRDNAPLDPQCACYACANFSRAYIRHLFNVEEITALILLTYHNLYYYVNLLKRARAAIKAGEYLEFKRQVTGGFDKASSA